MAVLVPVGEWWWDANGAKFGKKVEKAKIWSYLELAGQQKVFSAAGCRRRCEVRRGTREKKTHGDKAVAYVGMAVEA